MPIELDSISYRSTFKDEVSPGFFSKIQVFDLAFGIQCHISDKYPVPKYSKGSIVTRIWSKNWPQGCH